MISVGQSQMKRHSTVLLGMHLTDLPEPGCTTRSTIKTHKEGDRVNHRSTNRLAFNYRSTNRLAFHCLSNPVAPMDAQPRRQIPKIQFRVLIIGRANAGKTSILQRVCDTTESPVIYQGDEEVRANLFVFESDLTAN
jgi:hypothetical protein